MVKLVIPWLITFGLGFLVFLYGKLLQDREKDRKREISNLRQHLENQMGSALSTAEPAGQKSKGAAAGAQNKQGASSQLN